MIHTIADKRATNRILDAGAAISASLGDQCDAVFLQLERQPGRMTALCYPAFQRTWLRYHNLQQLERDLAQWVKAWKRVLGEI